MLAISISRAAMPLDGKYSMLLRFIFAWRFCAFAADAGTAADFRYAFAIARVEQASRRCTPRRTYRTRMPRVS